MAGERPGHSLQATALVNEAYLRLITASDVAWRDRAHFLAVASLAMRYVLVDRARARMTMKRGGAGEQIVTLDDEDLGPLRIQNVLFRMLDTPGLVRFAGRRLGQDTRRVLGERLGLSAERLDELAAQGVI